MSFCSARRLDRGLNVFTGIFKNMYFLGIFAISTSSQRQFFYRSSLLWSNLRFLLLLSDRRTDHYRFLRRKRVSGLASSLASVWLVTDAAASQVVRINGRDWAVSLVLGFLSLPLAVLVRLLPPEPFERFMIYLHLFSDPNAPLPTQSPASEDQQWGEGESRTRSGVPAPTDA